MENVTLCCELWGDSDLSNSRKKTQREHQLGHGVCTYFTYLRSVVVATTSWIYVSSERIHVDLHSCSVMLLLSLLYLHVYVLWLQLASSTWKLRKCRIHMFMYIVVATILFFSKTRVKLIECPRGYTICTLDRHFSFSVVVPSKLCCISPTSASFWPRLFAPQIEFV